MSYNRGARAAPKRQSVPPPGRAGVQGGYGSPGPDAAQAGAAAAKEQQAGPAQFQRKPTDRNLPPNVAAVIPEAKLYKSLQDMERRLDATISRKKLDLQDILTRGLKKRKLLRVFVSSSVSGQPWQAADTDNFDFSTDSSNAEWNLRIEGRLVDDTPADSPTRPKFNTFFTSIIVEMSNEDSTDETPIENPIVEWHEPVPNQQGAPTEQAAEFDVIDIKRKGAQNVKAKITLQLKEFPNKFKLSEKLRNVLAIDEESKPGVVVALWQYIKFHKLQDMDEKRLIKCDAALKDLFQRDSFAFPQVLELLTPHLSQREPIVLEYTVPMDREDTLGETAYDIEVDVDFDQTRADLAKLLESWYADRPQIAELDNQIALAVQALNISSLRRDFFAQLVEDPATFMKRWSDSQVRDLRTILADRGFNEETVRRSSFYDDDLLSQSIHLFLNTR